VKGNSCLLIGRITNRSNYIQWTHLISHKTKRHIAANVKLKTNPIQTQNHMWSVCCNSITWTCDYILNSVSISLQWNKTLGVLTQKQKMTKHQFIILY
jgi:hypothetical protein